MSEQSGTAPIIVRKKVKRAAEGHHGGAWKVAYADFVTAMMAFFLLMWLLNATTEKQRKGLADYFDPSVPISPVSAGGAGVLSGDSFLVEADKAGEREEGVRPETTMPRRDGTGPDPSEGPASANGGREGHEIEAALERQLAEAIEAAGAGATRHLLLHPSPEGLVLELVDADGAPLFASGSAEPGPRLVALAGIVAEVLARTDNALALVGHTDSRPFSGAGGDNWRLSAERANAARALLVEAGLDTGRIVEVAGRAATDPLLPDPAAPQNRRIAVTLLRAPPR